MFGRSASKPGSGPPSGSWQEWLCCSVCEGEELEVERDFIFLNKVGVSHLLPCVK